MSDRLSFHFVCCSATSLALMLAVGGASPCLATPHSPPKGQAKKKAVRTVAPPMLAPVQLLYGLKPGETYHYRVTTMFDGIFPPFAQPGAPPIHLLIQLQYAAKVIKQDKDGTQAEFTVEAADLNLLNNEMPLTAKINPDEETPFPIELSEVQKALNTSVVLAPDGSVVKVLNAKEDLVKVNIGFDLGKLFLLLMPVTLPVKPVQVGDVWSADTGVIGSKPGSIHYSNRLTGQSRQGARTFLKLDQEGVSNVDDTLDKSGKSTTKQADVESRLSGKVTFKGAMKYQAQPIKPDPKAGAPGAKQFAMRLSTGQYEMQVHLDRKVTNKDMKPQQKALIEGSIDVKARMLVQSSDQVAQK